MLATLSACAVGAGLLMWWSAWTAITPARPLVRMTKSAWYGRWAEQLALAGWPGRSTGALLGICIAMGFLLAVVALVFTQAAVFAILGLAAGCALPCLVVRNRASSHLRARRDAWPDAVDHVASAVRAGLSIPESLRQLAEHGPEILREDFRAFARHDAAHGRFDDSLNVLKSSLADPAADRLIESLRLARNVGGSDVGRLLRTLSAFLREDAATRTELAARQSWTVSAARLALAAPWIALLIVGMRGSRFSAYTTPGGVAVLIFGSIVSSGAYFAMRAIGKLPLEERVMR